MLGYGAMELRGAPRGRDVAETQAETILNAVLDAGINYIDTSIDYGLSEERIGRYISERRSEYYLRANAAAGRAAPAPRGQPQLDVFTRDNICRVEQSLAACTPTISTYSSSTPRPPDRPWKSTAP